MISERILIDLAELESLIRPKQNQDVFAVIKSKKDKSFKNLYTAYVDDTTLFLKNQKSVIEILKVFQWFSKQPGLEPNTSKCEIVGIGGLKEVNVALYTCKVLI